MDGMTLDAREARRIYKREYRLQIYKREYRHKNREKTNRQQREWRAANPERVKTYQIRYWENKAKSKVSAQEQE